MISNVTGQAYFEIYMQDNLISCAPFGISDPTFPVVTIENMFN